MILIRPRLTCCVSQCLQGFQLVEKTDFLENFALSSAVEIKSFTAPSATSEFHMALGQYLNYKVVLKLKEPERLLYLAVSLETYESFFSRQLPQMSVKAYHIKVIIFDPKREEILRWID